MKTRKHRGLKITAITVACVIGLVGIIACATLISGVAVMNDCIAAQNKRLDELRANPRPAVDEQSFCEFDLSASGETPFNGVQYVASHNSYKQATKGMGAVFVRIAELFGAARKDELFYTHERPYEQLDSGIRSFELDISYKKSGGEIKLFCQHISHIDNASNLPDLKKGFEEIALWSKRNPDHMPITLLLECSEDTVFAPYKKIEGDALGKLNETVKEVFGDSLFTPREALDGCADFAEMRERGWKTLSETRGKIAVILHPGSMTEEYIKSDLTLETQNMFPALHSSSTAGELSKYAAVALVNDPVGRSGENTETIKRLISENWFVRTRTDSYPDYPEEQVSAAFASGANILSGDFPPRAELGKYPNLTTFNGKTMRLLPR